MPDYKKKKRSSFGRNSSPKRKQRPKASNIKMSQGANQAPESVMKVVRGKKADNKKRLVVFAGFLAAVLVFVLIFNFCHPAGVLEGIKNGIALMGTGNYPAEFENSRIIDVKVKDSYYFVLTSKQVKAYSNSGKELFSYTHGYENPVIDISQSRALVFDQGGKSYSIFTLSGLEISLESESSILTADMSDSGVYALVLESEEYVSAVKVYSKKNKSVYEWFSAKDVVNNVAVCYNGNKIAVSTFNAESGSFKSTVSILEYDSPTAIYTKTIDDGLIYDLESTFRSSLAIVREKEIDVISWSGKREKIHKDDYSVSMLRAKDGYVAVFNRENDKTDNKIVVLDSSGKVKCEVGFSGIISDIALRGKHIYCISDAKVHILDFKGEIIRETPCGFGAIRTVITDGSTALIVSDSKIEKVELERE